MNNENIIKKLSQEFNKPQLLEVYQKFESELDDFMDNRNKYCAWIACELYNFRNTPFFAIYDKMHDLKSNNKCTSDCIGCTSNTLDPNNHSHIYSDFLINVYDYGFKSQRGYLIHNLAELSVYSGYPKAFKEAIKNLNLTSEQYQKLTQLELFPSEKELSIKDREYYECYNYWLKRWENIWLEDQKKGGVKKYRKTLRY